MLNFLKLKRLSMKLRRLIMKKENQLNQSQSKAITLAFGFGGLLKFEKMILIFWLDHYSDKLEKNGIRLLMKTRHHLLSNLMKTEKGMREK